MYTKYSAFNNSNKSLRFGWTQLHSDHIVGDDVSHDDAATLRSMYS